MRSDLPRYGLTPLGGLADALLLDGTHVTPISRLPRSAAGSPAIAIAPLSSASEVEFASRAIIDAPALAGLADDVRANVADIEDWRAAREAKAASAGRNVYRG